MEMLYGPITTKVSLLRFVTCFAMRLIIRADTQIPFVLRDVVIKYLILPLRSLSSYTLNQLHYERLLLLRQGLHLNHRLKHYARQSLHQELKNLECRFQILPYLVLPFQSSHESQLRILQLLEIRLQISTLNRERYAEHSDHPISCSSRRPSNLDIKSQQSPLQMLPFSMELSFLKNR